MTPARIALLCLVLTGCEDAAPTDEGAAETEEGAEEANPEKKERNHLPGPRKRSYEHPDVPYTDIEKQDLTTLCRVLVDCLKSRCSEAKPPKSLNTDYGTLLADYVRDNPPRRAGRRLAELLKEDGLTGIDPACRQLVSIVL